jgi:hypothetical protein
MILLILTLFSTASFLAVAPEANAEKHSARYREFHDARYHLNRAYPARGQIIRTIPRNYRVVVHRGVSYRFHDGAWYRPRGNSFVVVAPPIGLFVSFLPPYYSTIWVRGVPYYYANDVYYAHSGSGYKIVEPPTEATVSEAPPPADELFIYPRNGQNEQQQAEDRYQCHRWAVSQTGFDPTQPQTGGAETQRMDKRTDYQRAMAACLDGRGYTVK